MRNRKRLLSLLLTLVMLLSLFPVSAFADSEQLVKIEGNVPTASVKVYDRDYPDTEIGCGGDGYYHLLPGEYFYTATEEIEGYDPVGPVPFTVTDGGDNTFTFTMTRPASGTDNGPTQGSGESTDDPAGTTQPGGSGSSGTEGGEETAVTGGVFSAHYGRHQVFSVWSIPAYPTGTQANPDAFTVSDLAAPFDMALGDEDYFYFVAKGPASQTGVVPSDKWNAKNENPYVVDLHVVKHADGKEENTLVGRGVIGAFAAEGFLFETGGETAWFSNGKGYPCSETFCATSVTYTPVPNGRLVCDVKLLTECSAQSMLAASEVHEHVWNVRAEGGTAVYTCSAEGCPFGTDKEYTFSLSVPAGSGAKAEVNKLCDGEWPAVLEQDVVYYSGRGDTEYKKSATPPVADGTYTAEISVGYRLKTSLLKVDYAIGVEETKDCPEQSFEQTTLNGVLVQVYAKQGAFPRGTKMIVSDIPRETAMEAAAGIVDGNVLDAVAVDISFRTAAGEKLEPAGKDLVSVKLVANRPVEGTTHEVIHITEDSAFLIGEAVASADEADFTAPEFSIYAIVGTDYTKEYDTYEFYDIDDALIRSQRVKAGDTLYEPETPVLSGQAFLGWYIDKGTEQVAFSGGKHDVSSDYTASGATIKLYPVFGKSYFATFYNSTDTSAGVRARYSIGSGQSVDFSSVTVDPEHESQQFAGWVDSDGALVTSPLTVTENGDGTVTWTDGGTWSYTGESLHLFPYFESGHWVYFNKNLDASAVSYTAPVFVPNGGKAARPADPVAQSEAYTFRNWYREPECTTVYNFDSVVDQDITLYAGWNTGNALYYVTLWKQKVTDRWDATEKTYEYVESHAHYGPIGSLANAEESEIAATQYWGFYLGKYDQDVKIKSDGSTVVNVYYDRMLVIEKVHYPEEIYVFSGSKYFNSWVNWLTFNGLYGQKIDMYPEYFDTEHNVWWPYQYDGDTIMYNQRTYTSGIPATDDNGQDTSGLTSVDRPNTVATSFTSFGGGEEVNFGSGEPSTTALLYNVGETSITRTGQRIYQREDGTWPKTGDSDDEEYTSTWNMRTTGTFTTTVDSTAWRLIAYSVNNRYDEPGEAKPITANSNNQYTVPKAEIPAGSVLYMYYERKRFNVEYWDGDKQIDSEGIYYEKVVKDSPDHKTNVVPENSDPAKKLFVGWSELPDQHTDENLTDFDFKMPSRTVKVYAAWAPVRYRVILNLGADDATISDSQARDFTIDYLDTIDPTLMMAAKREGYTIKGWYRNNGIEWNFENAMTLTLADNPDEDPVLFTSYNDDGTLRRFYYYYTITLTAHWRSRQPITVEYDLNGGSNDTGNADAFTDTTVYYQDSSANIVQYVPTPPEGMNSFSGWVDADGGLHTPGGTIALTESLIVDGKVTLTAQYGAEVPTSQIIYDPNGGTGNVIVMPGEDNYYTYNERVFLLTKEGCGYSKGEHHTLIGWSTDPNADEPEFELGAEVLVTPLTSQNKLYAVWLPDPVSISIPVKKIMVIPENLTGPADWSYEISAAASSGAPEAESMTRTATKAEPSVSIGPITFTKPGSYSYVITENGTYSGVTNDPEAASGKTVTVSVTDTDDGLAADVSATESNPLTFTNKYFASGTLDTSKTATALLKKTVTVEPAGATGWSPKSFNFTIESGAGAPVPPITSASISFTAAGTEVVSFGTIRFTRAGTFTYTIQETTTAVEGDCWIYDNERKTVQVVVTDKGNGTLKICVTEPAVVTNTYVITEVQAAKVWSNSDGSRTAPAGVETVFSLYADGRITDYSVTLDGTPDETVPAKAGGYESEAWTAKFVNLPKYKTGTTTEIVYTVGESKVCPGYTADATDPVADGGTVTNTQDTTEISVSKAWKNADGSTRAPNGATVVFTLYANGKITDYTVKLDGGADTAAPTVTGGYESEAWTAKFVNLPKTDSATGKDITYTAAETTDYLGYKASTTDPVADGETITNTQITVSICGAKVWKDHDNKDKVRPESITVILLADGEQIATAEVTEKDDWTWSFENLLKYVNGKEITYTVDEKEVPKYEKKIKKNSDGTFTITNTHKLSPRTGDSTTWWPWLMALILSGSTLVTNTVLQRKKKQNRSARRGS